jgi:hypothetical protein
MSQDNRAEMKAIKLLVKKLIDLAEDYETEQMFLDIVRLSRGESPKSENGMMFYIQAMSEIMRDMRAN